MHWKQNSNSFAFEKSFELNVDNDSYEHNFYKKNNRAIIIRDFSNTLFL